MNLSGQINATITLIPKTTRKEWKDERFPSPNMIIRSDYPDHDIETMRRTTRYSSPSPPYPGNTKPQRGTKAAR